MNRQEMLLEFKKLAETDNVIANIVKGVNTIFPHTECVSPDFYEDNVVNGEDFYWCLVLNKYDLKSFEIRYMKPYIWKNEDGSSEFGWSDEWGNFYSNIINPIHGDSDDSYVYGRVE